MQTHPLSFFVAILLATSPALFAQESGETNQTKPTENATEASVPATISGEVKELPEEFKFVQDDIKLVEFLMVLKQQVVALQKQNQELTKANDTLSTQIDAQAKLIATQAAELQKQSQEFSKSSQALTTRIDDQAKQIAAQAQELSRADEALIARIDAQGKQIATKVAEFTKQDQALTEANKALTTRVDAQEKTVAAHGTDLQKQTEELAQAKEALSTRIDAHEKQTAASLANLEKQSQELVKADEALGTRLDAHSMKSETRIAAVEKQGNELTAKLEKLQADHKESTSSLSTLTTQLETLALGVVKVQETVGEHASILGGSDENKEIGLLQRITKAEERLSTHSKDIEQTSNDLQSLTSNVDTVSDLAEDLRVGVSDTKARLNAISYPSFEGHSSDNGSLALRGNMAQETFQKEFHQIDQFRVQFFNFTGQEQFILVNGVQWRVRTGTSYVNVPRGKVRIGYRGEWSTLEDWIVDDEGYFINFALPVPYENQ